jgi:hypothetical protein
MNTIFRALLVLAAGLLASPALARDASGLDLTLHYGADAYNAVGLRSGLGGLDHENLLAGTSTTVGATAIFFSGMGELGAIGELGRPGKSGATSLLGVLGGLGHDLGAFRLEVLGELGAHKYGDLFHDAPVTGRSKAEAWLVSAGVRPGLSLRFGARDAFLIGVWGFARWDVTSQDVQVTLANGGSSHYRLGGSQYGASLRAGISL